MFYSLFKYIHLFSLYLLVTACSSGGGGSGSFTVTATAGADGSISPGSATVAEGNTTSFTLTADVNYAIDTVSGCGGSLTGNTYTTGPITADCTVTANFGLEVTSFELIDPTPGAGDNFGELVVILGNGNIVVTDPNDSSVTTDNGAIHLYNPVTQTRIASFYGDNSGDSQSISITDLGNNNFVIALPRDNVGGISGGGSVRLIDGNTGAQIGATIAGDVIGDQLGSFSGITALANNNFVVASPVDDEGGVVDAGSVRLINGSTGVQIGATLIGDIAQDSLGLRGITALGNNNFVIASGSDTEGGVPGAGSVRLINGSTGVQIGATLAGDTLNDGLGSVPVTALGNNNFVVVSTSDDEGGVVDAGSVRLVNGSTGVQIGATLAGDVTNDLLGFSGVTALGNNNYVIATRTDDEGGITDAGSVRLVDGSTGAQIGVTIAGDVANDLLGNFGITVLSNNNFVIVSINDDEGSIVDAGSVRLVDGSTGTQIGATIAGDVTSDFLGRSGITSLGNNNFVIASRNDDEGGIVNAGSVRLVSGSTGVQIGTTIAGDVDGDFLSNVGTISLGNGNFVIGSANDDEGGVVDAGSVRLVNGSTGVQIGASLLGDNESDFLSAENGSKGLTALATNNFVVASSFDNEGGITNAGSVRLVDGSTGAQIGSAITGAVSFDFDPIVITPSATGLYYILAAVNADNGMVDSGLVRVIAP